MKPILFIFISVIIFFSCQNQNPDEPEPKIDNLSVRVIGLSDIISVEESGGRLKNSSGTLTYHLYGEGADQTPYPSSLRTVVKEDFQGDTILITGLSDRNYRLSASYSVDGKTFAGLVEFNPVQTQVVTIILEPKSCRFRIMAKEGTNFPGGIGYMVLDLKPDGAYHPYLDPYTAEVSAYYEPTTPNWKDTQWLTYYYTNSDFQQERDWTITLETQIWKMIIHTTPDLSSRSIDPWNPDAELEVKIDLAPGKSYTIYVDFDLLFRTYVAADATGNIDIQDFTYVEETIEIN